MAVRQGIARLFVEANESACYLFERKGFTVHQRRDLQLRGVWLHNYEMDKPLVLGRANDSHGCQA